MATKKKSTVDLSLQPRFRLLRGREIAMGPGKADLLRHLAETGSITESAARMKMSYMRAWTLIKTMNACFREPLVISTRGGIKRGGAELTDAGRIVLGLYEQLDAQARAATKGTRRRLLAMLRS